VIRVLRSKLPHKRQTKKKFKLLINKIIRDGNSIKNDLKQKNNNQKIKLKIKIKQNQILKKKLKIK